MKLIIATAIVLALGSGAPASAADDGVAVRRARYTASGLAGHPAPTAGSSPT